MCSQLFGQIVAPAAPALQLIDEPLPTPERAPGAVASSKAMEWKLHAPPSADAAPR
jgi:hypothetical protein